MVKQFVHTENIDKGLHKHLTLSSDERWLKQIEACVLCNLPNSSYTVSQLASELHLSERQLRRRLKKLLGIRPQAYLTQFRLKRAHLMLVTKQYKTVAQIAYANGFANPSSFAQSFKRLYGQRPSDFLR
jgi:AraC-like DNA-binding protein